MKLSRRDLIKGLCAGTCGAALHRMLSPATDFMAFADPLAIGSKFLVVLDFQGGCSLNVAPIFNGTFYDLMPVTSFKENGPAGSQAISLVPGVQGLHPSLTNFKTVWDEGNLALMNLVGYPDPNRSHDESAEIWYRAAVGKSAAINGGWGARLTQMLGTTYAGFSLSGASLIAEGGSNPPLAIDNLNDLGEDSFWNGSYGSKWLRDTRSNLIYQSGVPATDNLSFLQNTNVSVDSLLLNLATQTNTSLPVSFPTTSLGNKFRDVSKIVKTMPARFFYLSIGGFDTHSNEKSALASRLNEVNGAVGSFISCMKALGRWDDTILITMSEFGRTFENGNGTGNDPGTDHGHGAAMFCMGGRVKGGIRTPPATSAEMLYANSKYGYLYDHHIDFREVFKRAVLAMGINPDPIFVEPIPNTAYTGLDLFV